MLVDPDPDPDPSSTFTRPFPDAISGLGGWWDAGTFAGLLDASARPLPAWNNAVASIADKSERGQCARRYRVSGSTLPQATPRLNGSLGGIGLSTIVPPAMPQGGEYLPKMDGDPAFGWHLGSDPTPVHTPRSQWHR